MIAISDIENKAPTIKEFLTLRMFIACGLSSSLAGLAHFLLFQDVYAAIASAANAWAAQFWVTPIAYSIKDKFL